MPLIFRPGRNPLMFQEMENSADVSIAKVQAVDKMNCIDSETPGSIEGSQ
jgi:hypothetical protein